MRWFWTILRIAYGAFFIVTALAVLILLEGRQPPASQAPAQAFYAALNDSLFINPLLIACHVAGGALLLFRRTAPLGLALLAPSVTVIFFVHLLLTGAWVQGAVCAAIWLALAWRFRDGFSPLWNYRGAA